MSEVRNGRGRSQGRGGWCRGIGYARWGNYYENTTNNKALCDALGTYVFE